MAASQPPGVAEQPKKGGRYQGTRPAIPDSRARVALPASHPDIDSVTDRIEYIAGLMADDVWNERTTKLLRRALAAQWGVAESTILNYSTEAGRSIDEAIKERRAVVASRAIERLELLAVACADSTIPGDSGSAVRANEVLLKVTGYSEPEEDKSRPTTLIQIGQRVSSPVFAGLLNGSAKRLNGKAEDLHANGADDSSEEADELPGGDSDGAVDRDPRGRH
jgi:hypothetical protein